MKGDSAFRYRHAVQCSGRSKLHACAVILHECEIAHLEELRSLNVQVAHSCSRGAALPGGHKGFIVLHAALQVSVTVPGEHAQHGRVPYAESDGMSKAAAPSSQEP